jgi:hypothetical protein
MKFLDVIALCEGTLLTPDVDHVPEIKGGFAGDLMSDVLASIQSEAVLITGLCNPQVVRTALIADIRLIIFARGKNPGQEILDLAIEENLPVATSHLGLYEISGRLIQAGLPSCEMEMNLFPKT